MNARWIRAADLAACLIVAVALTLFVLVAAQNDIVGPPGSGTFGQQVVVLANGNIIVTDPGYDAAGSITDTGAVYLYNGATGALISQLTGSQVNDQVGSDGVTALSNGNYVVVSSMWDNGMIPDVGAVTWVNGTTGITGVVSVTNSLVGDTAGDQVGVRPYLAQGITALSNGNYVVQSPFWDNGKALDAGAVTLGNGTTGITSTVSVANSLVGSTSYDLVGSTSVVMLDNGNYVVLSPDWDNGAALDAGAATWGNGTTGITGTVSATNSLVGSTAGDQVGVAWKFLALSNGNYVVQSPFWDNGAAVDAGAATWGNGTTGITGAVSITNSLVGSAEGDYVGNSIMALSNGNYVVQSPFWDNGKALDVGGVTWVNGTTGITGDVSVANSLVGTTMGDRVGEEGVIALINGNYVVCSPSWDNDAVADVGAATWGNGAMGITGVVSVTNSLVGSEVGDLVGSSPCSVALSNGNYVVFSPDWDNGAVADVGAATWGNGTTGITGAVSITNSLVGSTVNDRVGIYDGAALSNGNYVAVSSLWDNGAASDAGAVTWGNGTTGITGTVSATNSLVGSTAGDRVGWGGITTLSNGNYVVFSSDWHNGAVAHAGAVTWGSGTSGVTGTVSITNSLVGNAEGDLWGAYAVNLTNGNYVVLSPGWNNGVITAAGAATWGNGMTGITGLVSITNSLVGSTAGDEVSLPRIVALNNGNYLVQSELWHNGTAAYAGAVTWGNGTTGVTGTVSITNSLVGSEVGDLVGSGFYDITTLSNGNYVVRSEYWNNGAGAVTLGDGRVGTVGPITADNSVLGSAVGGGLDLNDGYDYINNQLVVGRPADNIVTLFRPIDFNNWVYLPLVRK